VSYKGKKLEYEAETTLADAVATAAFWIGAVGAGPFAAEPVSTGVGFLLIAGSLTYFGLKDD
jgi:hypothetical protein